MRIFFEGLCGRLLILLFILALLLAAFGYASPSYLTFANFQAFLRAMAINGIVALGLTFVIVTRRFDLSLAGVASLSAMTLGFVMAETNNLSLIIVAAISMGCLCGVVNGLLVGPGRLPDVVTTIAVGSIAYGLAFFYNGGSDYSKNFFTSGLVQVNIIRIAGLQLPVFILLLVAVISAYVLHASRWGQALYASGENPEAARFSGVSTPAMTVLAFAFCGAMVGVAMLLQIAGIGSARVTAGGQIMLPAYTSVYLGAALLGRVSIAASLVGVVVMTALLNGFTLLGFPYYVSDVVMSAVLILTITLFDRNVAARIGSMLRPHLRPNGAHHG